MAKWIGNLAAIAVASALVVLLGNAALSYHNIRALLQREERVQHSQAVIAYVQSLQASISDATAAQRGFLLSHNANFLPSYRTATSTIGQQIDQLSTLTADNPRQRERIVQVRDSTQTLLKQMTSTLDENAGAHQSSSELEQSRQTMDQLRQTLGEMRDEELSLLTQRQRRSHSSFLYAVDSFVVATAVAIAVLGITYWLVRRAEASRAKTLIEQNSLARYNQLLVESTGEGIYGIDLSGQCTFINAAGSRMLGRPRESLLGQRMHELTHHTRPDQTHYPATECPIYSTLRTGVGCRVTDELFFRADGSHFPVEYSAYPIRTRNAIDGVVVAFTDITERKLAEEELLRTRDEAQAANVAKSQFLANMSHELRTPLNAVIMYSELLQEEAVDRGVDSFVPDLAKICAGGKHLLALINGVLDLSKIEAGKMDLYLESFEVASIARDVASTVQPLSLKKNNKLKVEVADDAGSMYGDLTKVRQILFNLLSNAFKFTQDGTVTLRIDRPSESERDMVRFTVQDTGLGMTPVQMQKLFTPFTQADESTTRRFGGTGLGLAISRRFAQLMGGDITVQSELEKGSTFVVQLPARVEKPVSLAGDAPAATHTTAGAREGLTHVLVIDDEPAVRDLMSRTLAAQGIRPVTASDGESGLRLAREIMPRLIFLDVMMPRMDGWAVFSALKKDPLLANIPVVMLTIVADSEMGYVLGASEYLTKPMDRDSLTQILQKYRSSDQQQIVLIVEDDDSTRQVVARTLSRQGWKTMEAENGQVALERLKEHVPALVVLDLSMPVMDGFDFLASLRKLPEHSHTPVVVLTSKDLTADERSRLTGSVEKILLKGAYSSDGLLREVKQIVALCAKKLGTEGEAQAIEAASTGESKSSLPKEQWMPRILIVEDNEENRDSLSRRLQRRGYEVLMAPDGKVGIEMARTHLPNLMLMDMNMPELDGWEATRQIKADAAMSAIPVIAITAHAMSGDRERALEAGCIDYHTKPIEFVKLIAQIESILGQAG